MYSVLATPMVMLPGSILAFCIALLTWIYHPRLLSAKMFAVLGLIALVFAQLQAFQDWLLPGHAMVTELWRFHYAMLCIVAAILFHLMMHELDLTSARWMLVLFNWQFCIAFTLLGLGSGFFIEEVSFSGAEERIVAGWGIGILGLWFVVQICYVLTHCFKNWRQAASGRRERRRLLVLAALTLTLLLGMTDPIYLMTGAGLPLSATVLAAYVCAGAAFVWAFGGREMSESELARRVVGTLPDGLLCVDDEGRIMHFNDRSLEILGLSENDLRTTLAWDLPGAGLDAPLLESLADISEGEAAYECAFGTGVQRRQWSVKVSRDTDQAGQFRSYILQIVEPDGQKAVDVFKHQRIDPLTGLAGRGMLLELLESALQRVRKSQGDVISLLAIGVSKFSEINESYGHETGDELLRQLAQRLRSRVGLSGSVARLGGDEFLVLMPHRFDKPIAQQLKSAIREELKAPYEIKGHGQIYLNCYFGISTEMGESREPSDILAEAHRLLQDSNPDASRYVRRENRLHASEETFDIETLLAAMHAGEFKPHYQATFDIRTQKVVGLHTLMRWYRGDEAPLNARHFLPSLRRHNLLVEAESGVHRQVLDDAPLLLAAGHQGGMKLYFKLEAHDREADDLLARFEPLLHSRRIQASDIVLEVSEQDALADNVREVIEIFSGKGFGICLDRFGSGYSAMSQLAHMPISGLALGATTVRACLLQQGAAQLVAGIADMCADLNIELMAKGVGIVGEARRLRELGCHVHQGRLFSSAVDIDDTLDLLRGKDENFKHRFDPIFAPESIRPARAVA